MTQQAEATILRDSRQLFTSDVAIPEKQQLQLTVYRVSHFKLMLQMFDYPHAYNLRYNCSITLLNSQTGGAAMASIGSFVSLYFILSSYHYMG